MQTVWLSGTRFSPGTTTPIGTSGDDEMKIEQSFTTLVAGKGDDVLEGTDDTSLIDKFYGGTGDDVIHWSTGFNIIHGGQPSLDYAADGTDTADYTGVGEVLITLNKHAVPHRLPTFLRSPRKAATGCSRSSASSGTPKATTSARQGRGASRRTSR